MVEEAVDEAVDAVDARLLEELGHEAAAGARDHDGHVRVHLLLQLGEDLGAGGAGDDHGGLRGWGAAPYRPARRRANGGAAGRRRRRRGGLHGALGPLC